MVQKNFRFHLWASDKPIPSLSKITYKYNSMLTYIPVSFLLSFDFRVRLGLKLGLGLGWALGLGLGFGFGIGIGNLTGGAAGTAGSCARKTPVI